VRVYETPDHCVARASAGKSVPGSHRDPFYAVCDRCRATADLVRPLERGRFRLYGNHARLWVGADETCLRQMGRLEGRAGGWLGARGRPGLCGFTPGRRDGARGEMPGSKNLQVESGGDAPAAAISETCVQSGDFGCRSSCGRGATKAFASIGVCRSRRRPGGPWAACSSLQKGAGQLGRAEDPRAPVKVPFRQNSGLSVEGFGSGVAHRTGVPRRRVADLGRFST